jgi:hypothetical protein
MDVQSPFRTSGFRIIEVESFPAPVRHLRETHSRLLKERRMGKARAGHYLNAIDTLDQ